MAEDHEQVAGEFSLSSLKLLQTLREECAPSMKSHACFMFDRDWGQVTIKSEPDEKSDSDLSLIGYLRNVEKWKVLTLPRIKVMNH